MRRKGREVKNMCGVKAMDRSEFVREVPRVFRFEAFSMIALDQMKRVSKQLT